MTIKEKSCRNCGVPLTDSNRKKNGKTFKLICKACDAVDVQLRYMREREKLIKLYGGCCAYCGDNEHDHMQLDHIAGDAKQDRESLKDLAHSSKGKRIWRNALATYQPHKYQILCYRCNAAKSNGTEAEFDEWLDRVYTQRRLQRKVIANAVTR